MTNYKTTQAIQRANEKRIAALCNGVDGGSGIYVFTRTDEEGIRYAYIGQAVNLLKRTAEHLSGFAHIDLSIKKHGLYNGTTCPNGWSLTCFHYDRADLDRQEREFIKIYAQCGYQLRNKTTGGQCEGKRDIADRPRGGWRAGKREGYRKACIEIGQQIERYTTGLSSKGGAVAERKTRELLEKLRGGKWD